MLHCLNEILSLYHNFKDILAILLLISQSFCENLEDLCSEIVSTSEKPDVFFIDMGKCNFMNKPSRFSLYMSFEKTKITHVCLKKERFISRKSDVFHSKNFILRCKAIFSTFTILLVVL